MPFSLPEDQQMIVELVKRFVAEELLPLEQDVLRREAAGGEAILTPDQQSRVDKRAKELGLWGMDAPEEYGGSDLPHQTIAAVNIALGRTAVSYTFPPDSPNLRMLLAAADAGQKEKYLLPYVRGETISAIGISEPDAGSDPRRMKTRARKTSDGWAISGTKIWISKANKADFTILMALTSPSGAARSEITAFLVDHDLPGITVSSPIRMLGGTYTYEVRYDDVQVPDTALLGKVGKGFGPMQTRLATRRLEIACWSIGMAERALDMMINHVGERTTFGQPLSERQSVQWWIAEAAAGIHSARLLALDIAQRMDAGLDVSTLVSMIKFQASDTAQSIIENAMQCFGAMGMSKEMPLHLMAARVRLMRIYDGPNEIHRWLVARNLLQGSGYREM